ncbi:hypothetical protein tinsulaeT_33940 [Thalassotalea insulae]|uniref:DUF4124 domain-containing protein n=1 Tax=Thalassotalea insulae TaxID=2056778 RepID=A0ABQ6GWM3_9GAMM|nr:DUF4124 domain-containing protein [Thalassotalea insulae]GLX80054.1 hypothetical protein tinsulaeT_33940 [Thalassotalea insulae]
MQKYSAIKNVGFLLLCVSGMSFADNFTVYRWVDKNNVVHFSQNQPSHDNYTELTLSNLEKKPEKDTVAEKTQDQQQTTQEDQTDLNNKCQEAKTNLNTLKGFDNIQYTDSNGAAKVLSEVEKSQQIAINEKYVEVYCEQ